MRKNRLTTVSITAIAALAMAVNSAATVDTGYIETPSPCYGVQRIVQKKVYLTPVSSSCANTRGRVYLSMKPGTPVTVYADGHEWGRQVVSVMGITDVGEATRNDRHIIDSAPSPDRDKMVEEMKAKAQESWNLLESPEWKTKLDAEKKRVSGILSGLSGDTTKNPPAEGHYSDSTKLGQNEAVYLFVSSSMPHDLVNTYVKAAARLSEPNLRIVMRGFVGGVEKILPTIDYVAGVTIADTSCSGETCVALWGIGIDPVAFRRFKITSVPVFVYVKNAREDEIQDESKPLDDHTMISGDISLKYALSSIGLEKLAKRLGE